MEDTTIYGFRVQYEDATKPAIDYLKNDLSSDEAKVFFEYAKRHRSAQFEDDEDRNFTLVYNQNNVFTLTRRN